MKLNKINWYLGRMDVVKYLIQNRANLEAENYDGETILHIAALNGNSTC